MGCCDTIIGWPRRCEVRSESIIEAFVCAKPGIAPVFFLAGLWLILQRSRLAEISGFESVESPIVKGVEDQLIILTLRHSDIRLTTNVYTHVGLEDKARAIGRLAGAGG